MLSGNFVMSLTKFPKNGDNPTKIEVRIVISKFEHYSQVGLLYPFGCPIYGKVKQCRYAGLIDVRCA